MKVTMGCCGSGAAGSMDSRRFSRSFRASVSPAFPQVDSGAVVFFEQEEAVARQPYSVQAWLALLAAAESATSETRAAIYERALKQLPRSYKIWKQYVDEIYENDVRGKRIDVPAAAQLVELYERALGQLSTMPRLWLDYLTLLQELKQITTCRRAFDRALRALPITQHHRVWKPYIAFVKEIGVPATAVRVFRRYLMLEPRKREQFVEYLCSIHHYEEASQQLVILIEKQDSVSTERTAHSLWMQLCDMISQHPEKVSRKLNVEAILRSGIAQFTDEVGRLWCSLATYFVRLGLFESARDVYEEGIRTVVTVRDFSMIFDAYVKFIEAMLSAEMEAVETPAEDEDEAEIASHQLEVDRLLKIYEDVADRRPVLLNSVLLRQNPHNVREWEKRIDLQKADLQTVIRTYAEAVKTVDPAKSGGRLHVLWVKFAKFYEEHKDYANARVIFQKAVDVDFRTDQELANVYCEWADMELRQEHFEEALAIMREACKPPASMTLRLRQKTALTAKDKVHHNVKLWSLRLDLEESLGDLASTRAAYDDIFELKNITPQMVLNYATYLDENKYFEESFRVYERGLSLFPKFPYAFDLWKAYLTKFVKRYAGTKLERARDLHEQAVRAAPAKFAKDLYVKYADFEENFGMLRNVMNIYERATEAVPEDDQLGMYALYVKKAQKFFGVAKVREVYQRGIGKLDDKYVAPLCLKFAELETKLGEYDRARAIYAHASQFCDPRQHETSFWKVWHEFEVSHGSEHSFLEMLRIKRSVVAQYSQVNYVSAEIAPEVNSTPSGMVPATIAVAPSSNGKHGDAMASLEAELITEERTLNGDKKRKPEDDDEDSERQVKQKQQIVEVQNEEEIDLDDEED